MASDARRNCLRLPKTKSSRPFSYRIRLCMAIPTKSGPEFDSVQVISSDGAYALSSSWDKTLRLWELATGNTTRTFVGHVNDVLSVSFSADNRQIVSGSRDKTIKLWNTLGDCKFTITDKGHTEWVSCVRFSPNPQNPVIVSAGWDKLVKVRGCDSLRDLPRMLCSFNKVFATSEPQGHETNIHQCTEAPPSHILPNHMLEVSC